MANELTTALSFDFLNHAPEEMKKNKFEVLIDDKLDEAIKLVMDAIINGDKNIINCKKFKSNYYSAIDSIKNAHRFNNKCCPLYKWETTSDNKYKFNNIKILDMVTKMNPKTKLTLIGVLQLFFDEQKKNTFKITFSKKNLSIYISWENNGKN